MSLCRDHDRAGRTARALSKAIMRMKKMPFRTPLVNTGNATRLVRRKRPDGSPFKVREFMALDSGTANVQS
jgi:hypothetical protein